MSDDKGRVERRREPLDGLPKNQELLDAILERDRARLVKMYRADPRPWPDGIDHAGNRWYGNGLSWTDERIEAALDPRVFDPVAKPRPKFVKPEAAPWVALGVSRRTYFRQRAMVKAASGETKA